MSEKYERSNIEKLHQLFTLKAFLDVEWAKRSRQLNNAQSNQSADTEAKQ